MILVVGAVSHVHCRMCSGEHFCLDTAQLLHRVFPALVYRLAELEPINA